jgi:lambda family phage portal protein
VSITVTDVVPKSLSKMTLTERAVGLFAPARAAAMYRNRFLVNFAGQFTGARTDKTSLRKFNPFAGSADSDSIGDLQTLRARSRDLGRNTPIARGARGTSKTNIVGSGIRLRSKVDRELLGLSEEAAEVWERRTETLFHLWAKSKNADVARRLNFYQQQAVAFTSAWDSGDVFALRRYKEGTSFLALCVQLLEADRVCTPIDRQNDYYLRDGIELDEDGAVLAYHVLNRHPGDFQNQLLLEPQDWARIPAVGDYGLPLMVHLLDVDRIAQSRGVPMLAPVIESLKQLDRYAEAELMAAVVSAFFTVFIKSEGDETGSTNDLTGLADPNPCAVRTGEVELGSGTIAELAPGEDITTVNPNRPNANFDPFFLAVIRQIGIALGIPYEVLIMHFSSSYTASKAALETARQFFTDRRNALATDFCQPIYEWFLYECVVRGIVDAPGYLKDPIKRAAWGGSDWIGRAPIVLDAVKDANAAEKWIDLGVKTIESVTVEATGGDWRANQEQRGRECAIREELNIQPASPQPPKPEADPGGDSGGG